jgi:hypothetical protein
MWSPRTRTLSGVRSRWSTGADDAGAWPSSAEQRDDQRDPPRPHVDREALSGPWASLLHPYSWAIRGGLSVMNSRIEPSQWTRRYRIDVLGRTPRFRSRHTVARCVVCTKCRVALSPESAVTVRHDVAEVQAATAQEPVIDAANQDESEPPSNPSSRCPSWLHSKRRATRSRCRCRSAKAQRITAACLDGH